MHSLFLGQSFGINNPGPAGPGYALPLQTVEIQKKPTDLNHSLPFRAQLFKANDVVS